MSNSQRDLDTVISSQRDLDEHYRLMASEQQLEENSGGSDSDETTDDDMGDDEATDDVGDERTGDAETTDSGAAGDAEPKKQRKQRRPNRVGATKETFFAVNPQTGLPTHPPELARGYGLQLGAILRDVVSVNETKLRTKKMEHRRRQLLARLHSRYQFPEPYDNEDLKGNIVNKTALAKFSKNLSGYKTMLRGFIGDNETWETIHYHFPRMTPEDYKKFLENEELEFTKRQSAWGKNLADKNIGHHGLGCRGYEGKEPIWEKEDKAYRDAGLENPYDKYKNKLFRQFVRSRYRKEMGGKRVTKPEVVVGVDLVTDKKVQALETAVVSNLPANQFATAHQVHYILKLFMLILAAHRRSSRIWLLVPDVDEQSPMGYAFYQGPEHREGAAAVGEAETCPRRRRSSLACRPWLGHAQN